MIITPLKTGQGPGGRRVPLTDFSVTGVFGSFMCINYSRMSASDSYVGKYTKQKLLGKGTFGEAWLVVSTASGR